MLFLACPCQAGPLGFPNLAAVARNKPPQTWGCGPVETKRCLHPSSGSAGLFSHFVRLYPQQIVTKASPGTAVHFFDHWRLTAVTEDVVIPLRLGGWHLPRAHSATALPEAELAASQGPAASPGCHSDTGSTGPVTPGHTRDLPRRPLNPVKPTRPEANPVPKIIVLQLWSRWASPGLSFLH